MKLFISYAHDDGGWTFEFWRALQQRTRHEVWIDQRIIPASNWWRTIVEEIEKCDCFISVMSPKSVDSIYCSAELHFAAALGKPVLPLLFKACTFPEVLNGNQVQYANITNNPSMSDVLVEVLQSLSYIDVALARGEFPPKKADRPPKPEPKIDALETIQIAEDAAEQGNYSLAESLLQQVIENDAGVLRETAEERLEEIRLERQCREEYLKVKTLADNPATQKLAQRAWQKYVTRYGADYDPNGLAGVLVANDGGRVRSRAPLPDASDVLNILPPPFEWCEIPSGKVTLSHDTPLILIADDVMPTTVLLERVFENEGYRVHSVYDGASAIQRARELLPDLIILDINMPVMNGFEVLTELHENPKTLGIPTLLITALGDISDMVTGLNLRASDYLRKPFHPQEVVARVESKLKAQLEVGDHIPKGGHTSDVPTFQMAKYTITNSQYQVFIDAKDGYCNPEWWKYSNDAKKWRDDNPIIPDTASVGKNLPRTNLTWYEAVAFCRWLTFRMFGTAETQQAETIMLPSEQQWQRAAQGDDGRIYPWGNKFTTTLCNTEEGGLGKPVDVTEYSSGASPYGVMNMSGNVWEWCLTDYRTGWDERGGAYDRVIRGGSWDNIQDFARAARRYSFSPGTCGYDFGFRLVTRFPSF